MCRLRAPEREPLTTFIQLLPSFWTELCWATHTVASSAASIPNLARVFRMFLFGCCSSIHFWQLRNQRARLRTDITVLVFRRQALQHNAHTAVGPHGYQQAQSFNSYSRI